MTEGKQSQTVEPVAVCRSADSAQVDALIVDQVADALIYADREGIIRRWNRGATRVFGFSAEEAIGQSLDLIIPERLRAAHWAGYRAAIESAGLKLDGRPTLTRGEHKEGGKLYVEMSFALVIGPGEGVLGSVAMARDVTARVQKERERAAQSGKQ